MVNPILTDREIEDLEEETRRTWIGVRAKDMDHTVRVDTRMKQILEVKIRVLKELINERSPDNKSKQYVD